MKPTTKKVLQFGYLGITLLVLVVIGLIDPNLKSFFKHPPSVSPVFLALGFVCIAGYWLTDGVIIKYIASFIDGNIPFSRAMRLSIIGQFYSAITPASTGGQPVQIVYMNRDGLSVGEATGIISLKFLGFQTALCSFYIIGLVIQGGLLFSRHPDIFWLTTVGFVMNAAVVAFMLLAMLRTDKLNRIIAKLVSGLARLRIVRKKEKALHACDRVICDFHTAIGYCAKNTGKVAVTYLLNLLHHFCMFSVSFFIYKAFGLSGASFWTLMAMQALLYVAVSFIPTPGGSIVSEGGFYLFFSMYFPKELVFVSMVLWRLVTYYTHIAAGATIIVYDQLARLRRRKKA